MYRYPSPERASESTCTCALAGTRNVAQAAVARTTDRYRCVGSRMVSSSEGGVVVMIRPRPGVASSEVSGLPLFSERLQRAYATRT